MPSDQVTKQRARIQGLFAQLAEKRPDLIDAESESDFQLFEKAYMYGWSDGHNDARDIALDTMDAVRDVLKDQSP